MGTQTNIKKNGASWKEKLYEKFIRDAEERFSLFVCGSWFHNEFYPILQQISLMQPFFHFTYCSKSSQGINKQTSTFEERKIRQTTLEVCAWCLGDAGIVCLFVCDVRFLRNKTCLFWSAQRHIFASLALSPQWLNFTLFHLQRI